MDLMCSHALYFDFHAVFLIMKHTEWLLQSKYRISLAFLLPNITENLLADFKHAMQTYKEFPICMPSI